MLRAIAGVVVGYIVVSVGIMAGMAITAVVLGADGAYKPRSFEPSPLWIGITISLGLVAAILAGAVCATIAKPGSRAPLVLAGVLLVLGVVFALMKGRPEGAHEVRPPDMTVFDAMQQSPQPLWVAIVIPVIGAFGVMIGATLRRKPAA